MPVQSLLAGASSDNYQDGNVLVVFHTSQLHNFEQIENGAQPVRGVIGVKAATGQLRIVLKPQYVSPESTQL